MDDPSMQRWEAARAEVKATIENLCARIRELELTLSNVVAAHKLLPWADAAAQKRRREC